MAQTPSSAKMAGVCICLLGSLLLGPTTAMAEYDVKSALPGGGRLRGEQVAGRHAVADQADAAGAPDAVEISRRMGR